MGDPRRAQTLRGELLRLTVEGQLDTTILGRRFRAARRVIRKRAIRKLLASLEREGTGPGDT